MRVTGRNLVRTIAGEEVATFVPEALPPRDPPIEVDGKRAALLARAERALARLEVAGAMVPSRGVQRPRRAQVHARSTGEPEGSAADDAPPPRY